MNIATLLASNSKKSINRVLLNHVATKLGEHQVTSLEVADYPLPIYSEDIETESGIPETVIALRQQLSQFDAFILASPEHNSSMPAVFKNLIDWLSRVKDVEHPIFNKKPLLLLSTSPGARGGATNLQHLNQIMPWWGADIQGSLSLNSFYQKYSEGQFEEETERQINEQIEQFLVQINNH